MSELLSSISAVEKQIELIKNIIYKMIVCDREGKILAIYDFGKNDNYPNEIIGGLAATIEEFATDKTNNDINNDELHIHSITLEKIKLVFCLYGDYIFSTIVDPEYPDLQFNDFFKAYLNSFSNALALQDYGTGPDGIVISMQMILNLIDEELHIDLELGDIVKMYPYKLKEIASDTITQILEQQENEDEVETISDIPEISDASENITINDENEDISFLDPLTSLNYLMSKFVKSFDAIKSITLVRSTLEGDLQAIHKGELSKEIQDEIYNTVLGMIDTVSYLMEQEDINSRIFDLDGYWMYLQQVNTTSFLYVIFDDKSIINDLIPLVENIIKNVSLLYPEEI